MKKTIIIKGKKIRHLNFPPDCSICFEILRSANTKQKKATILDLSKWCKISQEMARMKLPLRF